MSLSKVSSLFFFFFFEREPGKPEFHHVAQDVPKLTASVS